jgi:hypothetical protein
MTTANGTYKFCDSDNYIAITLTCSGPSCSILQGNLTCTQPDANYWLCNNNRICTGSSSIISNFTLNQRNGTITETQYLLINGTSFVLTQDGSGNVTVANGTVAPSQSPSTYATATTATTQSPSSTTKSFAPRHTSSWPLIIFISVLALMAIQENAQNIPCISEVINEANLVTSLVQGNIQQVGEDLCEHFKGSAIEAVTGPFAEAAAMALCYERLFVYEGVLAFETGTAELLGPELALAATVVNTAICFGLVPCLINEALDQSANGFCSLALNPSATTASSSISSSSSSSSSSISPSTSPATPTSPVPTPGPSPGLVIPSVVGDQCASCQLSVYAMGIVGLASQCNVATPLGTAYDVSVLLCDSSYNGRYSQFCATLCANPCATYNIKSWIQSAGSQYMSTANLATCASLCPGFMGDGRCSPSDPCGCAVGAETCIPC